VSAERRRIRIDHPSAEAFENAELWRAVREYAQLIPYELEPNFGRVQEIREEIKKGTYLTRDKIDETAALIAIRLMKSER